jgi:two-component system, chemotaxis family, sensor kinase CheA
MPSFEEKTFVNQGIFSEASIREYLAEAEEQIAGMEEQLLVLEENRTAPAAIGELFRHLHGLKGNTGLLLSEAQVAIPSAHPLHHLQSGSHAVESAVDELRKLEQFRVSDEEMEFLFQAASYLQEQIKAFKEDRLDFSDDSAMLGKLGLIAPLAAPVEPASAEREDVSQSATGQSFTAGRIFLEQLPGGELPSLRNLHRTLQTLVKVARFGGNQVLADLANTQVKLVEESLHSERPLENLRLGELRKLYGQMEARFSQPPVEDGQRTSDGTQTNLEPGAHGRYRVIRVDQYKIDELMRIVGQMAIFRNQFSSFVDQLDEADARGDWKAELRSLNDDFSRSADQLQHGVISLRLMPLRSLFQRFPRLIRDLSVSLGKEIRLVTQGEEIQIDKALLDHLGEPLVHLLRNAADHGIESAEHRVKKGKPPTGTISIRAFRDASAVVVSIADDGGGIATERIRARAIEAGLISVEEAAMMDDASLVDLIFRPGFSTARSVSSVSGRGVGLDVVRKTIERLRGTLTVESSAGFGTEFRLRLPATVLISRGIVIEAEQQEYILPLDSVLDLVRVEARQIRHYRNTRLAVIDGKATPILFLRELLGSVPPGEFPETLSVAILGQATGTFGIAVDSFKGEVQTVIQPLNAPFAGFELCVGAAILGAGRVVLVLDANELSKRAAASADLCSSAGELLGAPT